MGYDLGIDLGTTYVAAAVGRADRSELLRLGHESPLMPSAVYQPTTGDPLVGEAAIRRLVGEPHRVGREFKRVLGDRTPIVLGGAPYPVTQLLTALVGAVLGAARDREGGEPDLVVLTRPANWGPLRRSLFDEVAGALVDGPELLTVTEPQAVAAHFAATERIRPGEIVAVYDLGGGGFEATVLARRGERVELLGRTEGVERLGGADVDEVIFRFVDETCGGLLEELDLDDPAVTGALARLRLDCGIAKETLSVQERTTIPVRLPDRRLEIPLTRARLETLVTPYVEATVGALERSLHSAGVTPEQLSSVLLLGGMARMPLVAATITDELGCPTEPETQPRQAVAMGAVILGEWLDRADHPEPPGQPRRTPPRNIWSPAAFGADVKVGAGTKVSPTGKTRVTPRVRATGEVEAIGRDGADVEVGADATVGAVGRTGITGEFGTGAKVGAASDVGVGSEVGADSVTGTDANAGADTNAGIGVNAGVGVIAGADTTAGIGANASVGASVGVGVNVGVGANVGADTTAGIGANVGVGVIGSVGVVAGVGANVGADAKTGVDAKIGSIGEDGPDAQAGADALKVRPVTENTGPATPRRDEPAGAESTP